MIFDTHCHAYWKGLKERNAEILAEMTTENVLRSVQVGTDWETSKRALSLARRWGNNTWCTAAMHPSSSQNYPVDAVAKWTSRLERFINKNRDKVIAVGETGLGGPDREARLFERWRPSDDRRPRKSLAITG